MNATFMTQNKGMTTVIDSKFSGTRIHIDLAIKIHEAMIYWALTTHTQKFYAYYRQIY